MARLQNKKMKTKTECCHWRFNQCLINGKRLDPFFQLWFFNEFQIEFLGSKVEFCLRKSHKSRKMEVESFNRNATSAALTMMKEEITFRGIFTITHDLSANNSIFG